MPAFTYVASVIASSIGAWALGSFGLSVVTGAIATGLAYVTSRIINGNQNKGNNSANTQGGRIQVPPATNNKIPVVYGSAYVNGIITDARLVDENKTMYYCLVLSEYTNNYTTPTYGLESVVWNDLRLTPVDATTNAHKVKDGRKVVDGAIVTAGAFVIGTTYVITKRGTTSFTAIGAQTNNIGQVFTATGAGTGTGQAQEEDFIDTSFIVDSNSLVELRVYAGGSGSASQIYPAQSTSNTANAYTFWANNDGSWTSANEMKGLVFAIVKMKYSDKGFTSIPNVTFQLANNIANPADVWYDYMTSVRYGAGIAAADLDSTALTAWRNFCAEDISYTGANLDPAGGAGTANQVLDRYQINGILDTSNQVKTNIDTILQNGGAWMSYNVATGLWSPVIKKAVTAGVPEDATTYFTATRVGNTLTVTNFPNGRIEAGQRLFNSSGTFITNITAQQAPTAGETAGQIGRYTTSTSNNVASATYYTLQPTAGTLVFNDDNIISGISISSTRLEDLYNKVEVEFYDKYNKDQKAYYRTSVGAGELNPNEPVNTLRMNLDLCNNSVQSDLIGQVELRQSRDDLVIEFTSTFYGIQTQAGDVIQVTSDLYGWAPKLFRVMRVKEQETEDGGLIAQIQALEYNPDAYTIEPITEFTTAANTGIGNLYSSVGLPAPTNPIISTPNPGASVPNFTFNVDIPTTGGPFDEIEVYYTEGWDQNLVTGTIVPGTGSNGVPVGKGLMTVTAVTYNSINVGDYFDLGNGIVESQLTQTTISTKTRTSGGAVGAFTVTLNNVTGVVIGQKPTGTGIPSGAMVVGVSGTTVTLDRAFTVQAAGSYLFTTAGGTGTYQLSVSTTASGSDYLFDQPVDTDFIFLKNAVPDGNATVFVGGTTVNILIVELPANSQTFRRYFLKARMGNKKNFGKFSPNTPIDIDGNNVNWQPNPTEAGRLNDLLDVNITSLIEGDTLYYDATASKWQNTSVLSVQDYNNPADTNFNVRVTQDLSDPTTSYMTVTAVATGTITIGAVLSGTGVTAGTTVLSAIGTANGGTGLYVVSNSQTVSSTTITGTGLSITASITPYNPAVGGTALLINTTQQGSKPIAPGFGSFLGFANDTNRTGVDRNQTTMLLSSRIEPTVNNETAELNIALMVDGDDPYNNLNPYQPQFNVLGNGNTRLAGNLVLNQYQANLESLITAKSGRKASVRTASGTGSIVTLTFPTMPYPFIAGLPVTVSDVVPIQYNGTYTVLTSTSTSITYASTATGALTQRGIISDGGEQDGKLAFIAEHWEFDTTGTATPMFVENSLTLRKRSTGTPQVGFGQSIGFVQQVINDLITTGEISVEITDITENSEKAKMNFKVVDTAAFKGMSLSSKGSLQIDGTLTVSSSEDVANAAAISLDTAASYFSTGATGETATLAAGSAGQFKSLMMVADGGGDMVITVTNAGWKISGTGTITFNAIGDSCLLQYINSKWFAIGTNSVVYA